MGLNEYNHFIKDYETIRGILKEFFIYGCYNKEQLIKFERIKGKKYDNESRRIRYFINKINLIENRINGKKIINFKYDRYDNIGNFLIKSFKTKTFNSQDINLHFFILQILSREQKELSINEIMLIIQEEVFHECNDDEISYRMLRDKLNELIMLGMIQLTESNPIKYKLAPNVLEEFSVDELNNLHQILYLFRNISPITVPAYFAQDTIKNYLVYYQGDDCLTKDVFLFKHTFLQNISNDEVIHDLLSAMRNQNEVEFIYSDMSQIAIRAIPMKIIYDQHYGRQFIFCFNQEVKKPQTYRIDRIGRVKVLTENTFESKDYKCYETLINKSWSMTQLNDLIDPMNANTISIEIDFIIDDGKEYIFQQLLSERRQGVITEISKTHWLYSIDVINPLEMIPWIRSYCEYAHVRKSEEHDIAERIKDDWQEVLKAYGVI